ncbi:hypothetical protein [Enterocloster alcoholdehydrogenati]|uniref:Uncharacterized protein n=1 Tax=Enterocloster alcoholdehydrogenati TaxID=2547410 RepID=A0ABQ0AXK0_9FIRM
MFPSRKKLKKVFLGRDMDLSQEEIEERFQTLSYLKIHPRAREENKREIQRTKEEFRAFLEKIEE